MVIITDFGILLNISDHCVRVEETILNLKKETFDNDKDVKDIVCFNIFQIGELAKHLSKEFIDEFNEVPWDDIKGMRDIIGHGYGTIDWDRVWNTATIDVKPLHDYCERLTKELITSKKY